MSVASLATQTRADTNEALVGRIKASAMAAALTLVLCIPIILFHAAADNDGAIYLIWRPWAVVIFVAIAFVGRFAVLTYAARPKVERIVAAPKAQSARVTQIISVGGLVVLFLFPLLAVWAFGSGGALKWVDSYGIQILIYVMLGWGLNIVVGLAGLLDLGYVAFYAVGAYSYTLLATTFGLSFWICLPIAGILAALWGMLLGFPVLRLRGDYLAIVTLAFGEIIRTILVNWVAFSGGSAGITSIPKITFFGLVFADREGGFDDYFGWDYSPIHGKVFLYYIILLLALLTNFVTLRLRRLPIGRAWEALREDEIACRSLGINTTNTKLTAFALGAFFGGLAGSFFAVRQGFISPESFTFGESATILAIVVLGGMGSQVGVAFAAAALIGGFELLRELEFVRYLPFDIIVLPIAIIVFALVNYATRKLSLAWVAALVIVVLGALAVRQGYLQAVMAALAVPFPGPIGAIDFIMEDFDPTQYRGLLFGLAMVVMMVFRPRGLVSTRSPSIFLKERRAVSGDLVNEGHG